MPISKPITDKELEKLQKEFLELDVDGDGTITVEELGKVLRSMRSMLKVSESEIKRVLRDIDKDGDGTINMKEYFSNMKNKSNKHLIHRALVTRSKARKQFMKFDKDGSGYITMEEIKLIFEERTGGAVSIEQIEAMLKDSDKNSDGKINYDEFVVMINK
jgi:calmodulin